VLAEHRPDWLSSAEREFIAASDEAEQHGKIVRRRSAVPDRQLLASTSSASLLWPALSPSLLARADEVIE
jgi:hypothetical protein